MTPVIKREMHKLLAALCDGTIVPEEMARLDLLIRFDPEVRQFYLDYVGMHVDLPRILSAPRVATRRKTVHVRSPFPQGEGLGVRAHVGAWRWAGLGAVATAACVLVAFLFQMKTNDRSPDAVAKVPVAHLGELQGSVEIVTETGEIIAGVNGQELFAGQKVRTAPDVGYAVIQFGDAVRLEVNEDSVLTLPSDHSPRMREQKVSLSQGSMRGEVGGQPGGSPFVVTTPHAEIRLLNTKFLSFLEPEATRVELEQGHLQLVRQTDGKAVEVNEGFYAVAGAEPGQMVARPMPQQSSDPRATLSVPARALAFSPDSATLATAGRNQVIVWDAAAGKMRFTLEGLVRSLAFSTDGKELIAAGDDPLVKSWNLEKRQARTLIAKQAPGYRQVTLSPDGRWLATAELEGKSPVIRTWDTSSGTEKLKLPGKGRAAGMVTFSPDAQYLATGVILMDRVTGKELASFRGPRRRFEVLAFTANGQLMAGADKSGAITIWDVPGRKELKTLPVQDAAFKSLALSPDGTLLAAGTTDGSVQVWSVARSELLQTLRADKRPVLLLAISPDGLTLASGSPMSPVKLWTLPDPDGEAQP